MIMVMMAVGKMLVDMDRRDVGVGMDMGARHGLIMGVLVVEVVMTVRVDM